MMAAPVLSAAADALSERSDFRVIGQLVASGSRVLDLGCGEGELLEWLSVHKQVIARGVEISPASVRRAIARGVSVFQGDLNEGLADLPDQTFDFVILSQTLPETKEPLRVVREMLRVGKRAIVSFPNLGHWRVRTNILFSGRSPVTPLFPYQWYETPNVHFLSIEDFVRFSAEKGFRIEHSEFLAGQRKVKCLPNLRAEVAVFLLT